jgi:8-oxo-dGTP pyrophosphatase MutT (NUDIX family)
MDFPLSMEITVESIKLFFQSFQRKTHENSGLISAAVLIPIFEREGRLHVVLTKRTNGVKHHKGQISFPGGAKDSGDVTIIDAALREAEEEIGLSKDTVELLGVYNDFVTPSGFCITPVVAFLPSMTAFSLNTSEVSEVFDVPLSFFLDNRNEHVKFPVLNGIKKPVYYYYYGEHEIWGATASLVRSFLIDLTE